MNKQYDVFISSNSKDYSIAEEVYDFLTKEGLHVFLACRELGRIGEAEYADAIDTALDSTTHMIVVASSISNLSSKWVHYEWSTFRSDKNSGYKNGNLVTILTDNVSMEELPAGLRHQQSFSYSSQHELKRLLSYLRTNKKYDSSNSNTISSFNTDLLIYECDENKLEAIVVGIQNTLEREILIPSYILYNGSNYWVTSIKDNAFEECKNLKCIFIPDTIVSIGYINNIESIYIALDNPKYCSLDGVLFNKEKTELIRYPAKKRENTYTIPNSIISIKDYAFADCEELISIFIPNGLTIIKENAFLGCKNLTSITIPQSVEIIGKEAFHGCLSLRCFDVSSKNKCYHSCDDVLFDKSETELIQYPSARKDNFYIVPYSVRSINAWAFGGNPYIKRVELPDGLETIGTAAFAECIELSSIKLPNSIETIGSEAFESCCKLTSIKLPDKLTTILDFSFCGCSSLASIIIPENVSVIGVNAFSSCDSLAKVILPDALRTIKQYAFDECKSLTEVVIPSKKVVIEYKAFPKNCKISYNRKWFLLNRI